MEFKRFDKRSVITCQFILKITSFSVIIYGYISYLETENDKNI